MQDYAEIGQGCEAVKNSNGWFHSRGVRIDVGHSHRMWEYGSAIQALISVYGQEALPSLNVLDVGAGAGALGPALVLNYNMRVTECDTDETPQLSRVLCNKELERAGLKPLSVLNLGLDNLPEQEFDAVFCISVVEHVENEQDAWAELAKRVKRGGLLFFTVDCVPEKGKSYRYDDLRKHNFTIEDMKERVDKVCAMGFEVIGEPDYGWHGCHVHDYSFFRAGFVREQNDGRTVSENETLQVVR
jgi:SAM-dependent methyltransferase